LALQDNVGELPPAALGHGHRSGARAFGLALARRVLAIVATLVASSFIVYSSLYLAPGDPIKLLSGEQALAPAAEARLATEYHLDEPFLVRYWDWLKGVVHGDLGRSTIYHRDVGSLLTPRIGTTVLLVGLASLLIIGVGIGLALIAGLGGSSARVAVTVGTSIGMGIPSFVWAILLVALFSVQLGWFPVTGAGSGFADQLWHLTLPSVALAAVGVAYVARIGAVAISEEANQDHVVTAIARGLARRLVIRRHVLRNAMIPIVTVSGIMIAALIAGTAIVETAFGLNGLGAFLISSVNARDFPVVQAICLIIVVVFVLVNVIVDLLYRIIDPRLRGGS
jgi:peptide/nickel transport system permease protein